MRISDWSSDVCSSDLFESSPPFGPWAATEVSTGIGSTVALSLEQPAIVSVSRTAPILQIDMPDMALICPKAAGDCQRILCLHGPRRQLTAQRKRGGGRTATTGSGRRKIGRAHV